MTKNAPQPGRWRRLTLILSLMVLVTLGVLGVLGFPAAADGSARIERAQRIAERVWGNPCGGQVTVARADLSAYGYDAMTKLGVCPSVVYLERTNHMTWAELCTNIIHEYGHIAGRVHSENPYSVMYEIAAWDIRKDGQYIESLVTNGVKYRARRAPGGDARCRR